jgi:uncharacterized protein YbjT (DUF2867 family)
MHGTILVTGAAGKTGHAIIHALIIRGQAVRAFIRRPEQVQVARAAGVEHLRTFAEFMAVVAASCGVTPLTAARPAV